MSKPARPGGVCSFCDLESSSCFQSFAHLRPFYAAVLGRAKARCRIRRCPAGSGLPFAPRGTTCVHRRRHVAMAQQLLNHANVLAALEQMRGKSVPVAHDTLCAAPLSPALRVRRAQRPSREDPSIAARQHNRAKPKTRILASVVTRSGRPFRSRTRHAGCLDSTAALMGSTSGHQ
jgi:hypothetical protein